MKIQLDTGAKTIKLESSVKLAELVKTLDNLLPNQEWKEFTLETNTIINNWSSPVVIREYPRPYYPWWGVSTSGNLLSQKPTYMANEAKTNYQLKSGVFNVEV